MNANSLPDFARAYQLERRVEKAKAAANKQPTVDAITWIEQNFYIPETPDHRFTLAPYQKRALAEAMRKDANGNYVYNTVVWSCIKKSLKSCIAAALALYHAYARDWSTIYVIANDLKQADSRVAYYIRRCIELNPRMRAECKINRYLVELPNHSKIEAIPIDPSGEAGSNADFLIFSELWGWRHESALRMWTEMTLSPMKFGKSQRWVETYAGFVGESVILESLYDTVVKEENCIDGDTELYASGSILTLWNTRPKHEWQTDAYYQSEAAILTPSEFDRVHRNKFSASSESFVQKEWWDACKGDLPDMGRFVPMVIGIDAAISGDTFAIVGVSRVQGITYVRYCNVWKPPKDGKIDFNEPRTELERLAREYNLECACFDSYQLYYFSSLIMENGIVYMREFPQGGKRLESDRALYDIIRERKIMHTGDETLTEHVMNANKEVTGDDRKMRIVKRGERMHIDAAVALSMAAYTCEELNLG